MTEIEARRDYSRLTKYSQFTLNKTHYEVVEQYGYGGLHNKRCKAWEGCLAAQALKSKYGQSSGEPVVLVIYPMASAMGE